MSKIRIRPATHQETLSLIELAIAMTFDPAAGRPLAIPFVHPDPSGKCHLLCPAVMTRALSCLRPRCLLCPSVFQSARANRPFFTLQVRSSPGELPLHFSKATNWLHVVITHVARHLGPPPPLPCRLLLSPAEFNAASKNFTPAMQPGTKDDRSFFSFSPPGTFLYKG